MYLFIAEKRKFTNIYSTSTQFQEIVAPFARMSTDKGPLV